MGTQQVVLLFRTSGDNEQMSEQANSPSPRMSPPPPSEYQERWASGVTLGVPPRQR